MFNVNVLRNTSLSLIFQVAPYNTFYSQLEEHMNEVGVEATINRWDEPLALGVVDPHDSLSHPAGVSDVQAETATRLEPDQLTNFLVCLYLILKSFNYFQCYLCWWVVCHWIVNLLYVYELVIYFFFWGQGVWEISWVLQLCYILSYASYFPWCTDSWLVWRWIIWVDKRQPISITRYLFGISAEKCMFSEPCWLNEFLGIFVFLFCVLEFVMYGSVAIKFYCILVIASLDVGLN